ncbi:MAG TPA: choice-of-anchor Q domain-containing protein [Verrucomicrobiae bacterium]|nr:choice-of-anchor Q domain-containing protein [Verrucomicrobiae bacterium]
MKAKRSLLALLYLLWSGVSFGATLHVDSNSSNPVPPYATWQTAATIIQDAIDIASDGDLVLVTNGLYSTGGKVVFDGATNRVALEKPIHLRSVNGPEVTRILGVSPGESTNDISVRGAYLSDGATLEGFTIEFGRLIATGNGAGVWCESTNALVLNCIMISNSITAISPTNTAGGAFSGTLKQCQITGNSAPRGGGVANALLIGCHVSENSAGFGGGVYDSILISCTISNNQATSRGGGVFWAGARFGALTPAGHDNLVIDNVCNGDGGGFASGNAFHSLTNWNLVRNSAEGNGGGFAAEFGVRTLYQGRVEENTAGKNGGGAWGSNGSVTFVGTHFSNNVAQLHGGGSYNAGLQDCVLGGNLALNGGGSYQGNVAGCVYVGNVATGHGGGHFMAIGTLSNSVFHANSAATNGGGIYCVNTARIQNSSMTENRAASGGGAYQGSFDGCVIMNNHAINSGGGFFAPGVIFPPSSNTLVVANTAGTNGGGVVGGIWLRCLLRSNSAGLNGGGAYNASLQNCVLSNNSALQGGGAYFGSLTQCLVVHNRAQTGGAAHNSNNYMIRNCTIVENFATNQAGGVFSTSGATVSSGIVYSNIAPINPNYFGTANTYSCLTPLSAGISNLSSAPILVNPGAGNFRLQTNSPCINAGAGTPGVADLDDRARIVGPRIDIGAYEFQAPGVSEFTHWLQEHQLQTGGAADHIDSDSDQHSNWQEWIAGTNPTNPVSVLQLFAPSQSPTGMRISWSSVAGRVYFVEHASLADNPPVFTTIQTNIVGNAGTTGYLVSSAEQLGGVGFIYRVGVE